MTSHPYKQGNVLYRCAFKQPISSGFYGTLIKELAIQPALDVKHQPGVSVQVRQDEEMTIFHHEFTENVSPSCWRRQLKIC
ncbi:hypothetical protein PO124_02350 [Bacillus licheniformis]|nr:hypothetical protein [Bacillus licheniformis]